MGFGAAITHVLTNYVNFQGRARRSEYWWWALGYFIFLVVVRFVDIAVSPPPPGMIFYTGPIYKLAVLAVLLPSLAVTVRRLHDTDRSGFWILLAFIPVVGWIVLLIWYCLKGTSGSNQYGADPAV